MCVNIDITWPAVSTSCMRKSCPPYFTLFSNAVSICNKLTCTKKVFYTVFD